MASFSDHVSPAPLVVRGRRRQGAVLRPAAGVLALALAGTLLARLGADADGFVAAFVAGVLVAVSVVDIEERRIPNRIVLPAAAAVLLAQIALEPGGAPEWLLASFGAALFLLVPRLAYPAGMGLGDVKLAFFIGAALGQAVVPALVLAVFAAFVFAVVVLIHGGAAARKTALPFGPFLALGAIVVLLA
jgi:leader peptidase (prepilin peptidase) / N-methyltransferase